MKFVRDVEENSVSLRLRKPYTNADLTAHTILTDDVFSYVDFYFKTHKKIIKNSNGKKVDQNHLFYWEQAKNFYYAAKVLPIESAPLPMYYCMLNAIKAFLIYNTKCFDDLRDDLGFHGLFELNNQNTDEIVIKSLDNTYVYRKNKGVFCCFSKMLCSNFENIWKSGKNEYKSIKELLKYIPFVHGAYVSTYKIPRKEECFIPLRSGFSPKFQYP